MESEARARRHAERKHVVGVAAILTIDPEDAPSYPKRSPRPLCHTTSPRRRDEYKAAYVHFALVYADASECFRGGDRFVTFPRYAFPPPIPASLS